MSTATDKPHYIVAEISRTWQRPLERSPSNLISQQFEAAINTNHARGYKLLNWQLTTTKYFYEVECVLETIVAVFELDPKAAYIATRRTTRCRKPSRP